MTKNERLAVVDDRLNVGFDMLRNVIPGDDGFNDTLDYISRLLYLRCHIEEELREDPIEPVTKPVIKPVTKPVTDTPPDYEAPPEEIPPTAMDPDTPTLTKDQVRAELSALQNNHGVDVAGVMAEMGFAKLSEIPAERYGELLKLANSKVGRDAAE